ncbi:MAG: hypothetical protein LBI85_01125 [Spirochaetaceae bacterium]|jgi:hypothetical protein|nr:hypothetical protein [Spirochaetaceae bacterium]
MNKRINFEDNIFILKVRLRMLEDLVRLDADPEIYLGKTLDDLAFIDASLSSLLDALLKNGKLIEREEQFHNLEDTEEQLDTLLHHILNGSGSVSAAQFPLIQEKIRAFQRLSAERKDFIRDARGQEEEAGFDALVVSSDELSELLKDF